MKRKTQMESIKWKYYTQALGAKFRELIYEDPMSDLKNLRQEGNLQAYIENFEQVLHKVNMSPEYSMSCLFAGLKTKIQMPM